MLGVLRLGLAVVLKFNSPLPLCSMDSAERLESCQTQTWRRLPPQERKRVSDSNSTPYSNG